MPAAETAFTALRIEGGLLPPEFLARIAALEAEGQRPSDYGVPPGRTLRDEIGRYWSIAEALWAEYRQQRQRADVVQIKAGVERWLVRLLREVLGFSDVLACSERTLVGERSFPVSHRAHHGALPLILTTSDFDLDRPHRRFGEENRRRSPHATLQEYVNAEPKALWGILSNGVRLRVLRDNPSLTRPAFVEVDLERVFEEGLYADFTAFWLLAHVSRSAPNAEGLAGQRWETWRTEGAKVGQRALDNLRAGVTNALRELGSGFVEHSANESLRSALRGGSLTADGLHQQLLRLVYRLLFLFAAEDRNLLHTPEADQSTRDLYAAGYSLARLRERARFRRNYDEHSDLWSGLTVAFAALARGARPLALPALGGLFNPEQCLNLDQASVTNTRLLAALHALAFFSTEGVLQRVNYRDMGTEELGSVYESLLELHPAVQVAARPWTFGFIGDEAGETAKGHERKLSGSYYTPDSLVQELLRSALDPVIERTIRENPQDPRGALLSLKIVDPACGSGHFLLGAARHMADALARLETESDLPDEALRRHALRELVRRCIYGVDRNPLSVELCKTALWIETIEPGKPLSFLDAQIKCGDSLVGVFDLKVLRDGIPDEAFKELTGDDKAYSRDLRKRNKAERENPTLGLLPDASLPPGLREAALSLEAMPDDTVEGIEAKRRALEEIETGSTGYQLRVACDLWCAAFFVSKGQRPEYRGRDVVPTTDTVWRYLRQPSASYGPMIAATAEIVGRARFFHWPLAFPNVFAAGGFDVVLGNPPWERIKLQEQEFFASRHLEIAAAPNAAARRRAIERLRDGDPADQALHRAFEAAKRDSEAMGQFVRSAEQFPLTAVGDVNTYALFAERFLRVRNSRGRAGLIVPTGIVTDDSTKAFFSNVVGSHSLVSMLSFENEEFIFPGVHHSFKFGLMTLGSNSDVPEFVFFARRVDQIHQQGRRFTLNERDIALVNPNSLTCPLFRSSRDAELTKLIHSRAPILIDEARGANDWGVSFGTMFHMSSDSHLFRTAGQLAQHGGQRRGPNWEMPDGSIMAPLFESKMFDQYDHRYADYSARVGDRGHRVLPELTASDHDDPSRLAEPYYWIPEEEVRNRVRGKSKYPFLLGYGEATTAGTFRTLVMTAFPTAGVGHKTVLVFSDRPVDEFLCFYANANSLVLDYVTRQKVSLLTLGQYTFKQLPFLNCGVYNNAIMGFIKSRVTELSFTSYDMVDFATALGFKGAPFGWDEDRRSLLRAEIDAVFARLYGLDRNQLRYILDPPDVCGSNYPSETFRVLKENEIRRFGEYRTARLVLRAWDQFEADGSFADRAAA